MISSNMVRKYISEIRSKIESESQKQIFKDSFEVNSLIWLATQCIFLGSSYIGPFRGCSSASKVSEIMSFDKEIIRGVIFQNLRSNFSVIHFRCNTQISRAFEAYVKNLAPSRVSVDVYIVSWSTVAL